jgi:hypothetical protein
MAIAQQQSAGLHLLGVNPQKGVSGLFFVCACKMHCYAWIKEASGKRRFFRHHLFIECCLSCAFDFLNHRPFAMASLKGELWQEYSW